MGFKGIEYRSVSVARFGSFILIRAESSQGGVRFIFGCSVPACTI